MNQFLKYYVRLFMLLIPILFLPMVVDPFGIGKNMLIMAMAVLGLVIWIAEVLINKKDNLKLNLTWGLMLTVVVWAWIGWFRMSPGVRMSSVMDITGVGMMTAGLVWFFLWLQIATVEEKKKQLNWLTASGIVVAIASVIVFLLPAKVLPMYWPKDNPIISINQSWSLAGLIISELVLMVFLVVEWGGRLVAKLRGVSDKNENYILEAVMTCLFGLVLALDLFKIFKNGLIVLDINSAWAIAVETFKVSPIWGMGAGNFVAAFNSFRPESYNLTQNWMNSFLHSNTGVLNYWTELGIIGMIVGVVILMGLLKLKKNYDFLLLTILVIANLFLPVNMVGIMLLIWAISQVTGGKRMGLVLKMGDEGFNIAPAVLGVVVVGGAVFSGYWFYKIVAADNFMYQSLLAASKNNGGETYNLQIKAIGLNPTMAEYRRVYSQTNLALASTLLVNKDITEEDKQKASTLIQQSVREAKAAIALDSQNPIYWVNLANIYRQLIGVVDGSADWSFQAYQQANVFDPVNPVTMLEMGGLLFAANRFEEADRVFEKVVVLKPNFANGWYNWAYSAKKLNRLDYAISRLTQALALVAPTSEDYEKASGELEEWKKELENLNKKQAAPTQVPEEPKPETLKAPEVMPTSNQKEQIVVPTGELVPPVN